MEIPRDTLFSRLPKWCKITLIILSIITIVYWAIFLFIKIWTCVGFCLHWITYNEPTKRNWWIYTTCVLILIIGSLVVAEIFSPYKPFTSLKNGFINILNFIKPK